MKKKIVIAIMALLVAIPATKLIVYADEGKKESAMEEKSESPERQHKEEQAAYNKYEKAFKKYGAADVRTKKAWKHYEHELAEHGHQGEGKQPLG